jgi:hypothetical protein
MPLSPSEVMDAVVSKFDFKSAYDRIDAHLIRVASCQHVCSDFSVALDSSTPGVVVEQILATYKEKGCQRCII